MSKEKIAELKLLHRSLRDKRQADRAKSVIAYIFKQYKVRYSLSGVTDLLHRLGFSYKKPTHVPGKQDPAKQQAFLEEYEHIKATKSKNGPIYFADTTHPQHLPAFSADFTASV